MATDSTPPSSTPPSSKDYWPKQIESLSDAAEGEAEYLTSRIKTLSEDLASRGGDDTLKRSLEDLREKVSSLRQKSSDVVQELRSTYNQHEPLLARKNYSTNPSYIKMCKYAKWLAKLIYEPSIKEDIRMKNASLELHIIRDTIARKTKAETDSVTRKIGELEARIKQELEARIKQQPEEDALADAGVAVDLEGPAGTEQTLSRVVKESPPTVEDDEDEAQYLAYTASHNARVYWSEHPRSTELVSDDTRLKLAYNRLVGSKALTGDALEGMDRSVALRSIQDDVDTYVQEMDLEGGAQSLDVPSKELLGKMSEQLQYASDIASKLDSQAQVIGRDDGHALPPPEVLESLVKDVHEKVSGLTVGEEVILPGGYSGGGDHAVLYSIKKTGDKFSFTIYNTGWGFSQHKKFLDTLGLAVRGQTSETIIDDIDPKLLSEVFLGQLLSQGARNFNSSSEEVGRIIKKHLISNKGTKVREGRKHKQQTHGTCAHSCVCMWLESSLARSGLPNSKVLAARFNLHMAKSGLKTLNRTSYVPEGTFYSQEARKNLPNLEAYYGTKGFRKKLIGKDLITKLQEIGESEIAKLEKVLKKAEAEQAKRDAAKKSHS